MSEEQVVRNCAPTLAGLKTGNLFACPYESREDLLDFLRSLNRRLGKKGVRAVPLRIRQDRALIYLYRASAAGKRPLLRILRSAPQRVRLQLPGRQPMPDKACPEIKAAGGFPPRDRLVSELSAGGREGLLRAQTLQMRGLLEGL